MPKFWFVDFPFALLPSNVDFWERVVELVQASAGADGHKCRWRKGHIDFDLYNRQKFRRHSAAI